MKKFFILFVSALAGCSFSPAEFGNVAELDIDFVQPTKWDGKTIPAQQICRREGGRGSTPPLYVDGIPRGTNLIILEINNIDVAALADAGQGSIGFYHNGESSAVLMPVPGETFRLPSFAFEEKARKLYPAQPWPYMPPCHMKNYHYTATVMAVRRTGSFDKQKTVVLGAGSIDLGRY